MSEAIETLKRRRSAHLEMIGQLNGQLAECQSTLGKLTTERDRSFAIIADLERAVVELGGTVE